MKKNHRKRTNKKGILLAVLLLAGAAPATEQLVEAATSTIDVTVSTIPGTSSPDPWTNWTGKADNEQNFYVNLHTISGASTMRCRAYAGDGSVVSNDAKINSTNQNYCIPYTQQVSKDYLYRLYFYCTEANYVMVKATGKYTP